MIVAGVDFSLTCPAVTIGEQEDFATCEVFYYTKVKKYVGTFNKNVHGSLHIEHEHPMERIEHLTQWAVDIIMKHQVKFLALEGYSMGSKGRVFDLAENTGLFKWKLWRAGIPYTMPSPTTIKKEFAGKGNVGKGEMYEQFVTTTGIRLESILDTRADKNPISDIVDSYAVYRHALANAG